tara:strand:- start:226 stop:795 length:570 start_codon:yes stop_codon:yes gene_type:complete
MKEKMILGLDISTSTIGWSVLPLEGFSPVLGFIPLSKLENLYSKASRFKEVLLELSEKYDIQEVFIEEDLKRFRRGFSSASTLQMLSRFNGMSSLIVYQTLDLTPTLVNVNKARKMIGVNIDRKDKTKPTKDKVFEWVVKDLGSSVIWPTKVLKSGPRKGLEILITECGDMSDGYVISKAGQVILSQGR